MRTVEPGELGGSQPQTYVGQIEGPFLLPCHEQYTQERSIRDPNNGQCAGAAIMRANLGIATKMPAMLHSLPADTSQVFASHAEFLAHHEQITLEEAQQQLRDKTPAQHLWSELQRSGVEVHWRASDEAK